MPDYVVALTTCPVKNSKDLARKLVETRVCACVNIIPKITSIYHWKDEIVVDSESILIMKTDSVNIKPLWESIRENHPYEVPEFVVLPIQWGSQDYLDWISENITRR